MSDSPGEGRIVNILVALLLIVTAGALGWAFAPFGEDAPEAPEIDLDAPVGGPFTLTASDGARVSDADFRGRYMLMVFGYTYCPDVCPTSLLTVTRALGEMDPTLAAQVAPIFVSVDPERDSPQIIDRYLQSFHPDFVGLTGTPAEIRRMATAYAIRYARSSDPSLAGYLVDHSTNILLMGPNGAYLTNFSPQTPPRLMARGLERHMRG